ncbi:hypothetical protein AHAS_Ahas13G0178900 [Arachis hypogaea]
MKTKTSKRETKMNRIIFTHTKKSKDSNPYGNTRETNNPDKKGKLALIRYAQQPNFRRDIIKGSIRVQRLKTIEKIFKKVCVRPIF